MQKVNKIQNMPISRCVLLCFLFIVFWWKNRNVICRQLAVANGFTFVHLQMEIEMEMLNAYRTKVVDLKQGK